MIEQFYESIIRTNDTILKETDDIIPMVFFIKEKIHKIDATPLIITKKNKEQIQLAIKAKAVKSGYGYILVVNTVAKRKKRGILIEGDCCIRAMYTPTKKIIDMAWHKNGEILAAERIEGRKNLLQDSWDAWNEGQIY